MTTTAETGTPPVVHARRNRRIPSAWHIVLIPTALLMATPLVWMLITSLSTLEETRRFPPQLPSSLHWDNYVQAWTDSPFGRWLINSTIVSTTCVREQPGAVQPRRLCVRTPEVPGQASAVLRHPRDPHGAVPGRDDPDVAHRQAPAVWSIRFRR